jgi:hypothetical protein
MFSSKIRESSTRAPAPFTMSYLFSMSKTWTRSSLRRGLFELGCMTPTRFQVSMRQVLMLLIRYDSCSSYPVAKKTMIGAFACDATTVYTCNKDHEYYRRWVPLMDDEDADDVGVQGYLKLSIIIVGPGDKMKVHDEEAEIAKEMAEETKVGGDIGSLVMDTPTIRKEWQFLVVSVYRLVARVLG